MIRTELVQSEPMEMAGETTDLQLAALARSDAGAFAELYRRHVVDLYRYCLRRMGEKALAEDATSQTFEQALRAIHRFRADAFRPWLFTIARNVTIDQHRKRRDHAPLPDGDVLVDRAQLPESAVLARDGTQRLRSVLQTLSKDQCEVMELRLAGLTNEEIAGVIGKRVGAVRMLVHRAVVTLRDRMAKYGLDDDA